MLASIDEKEFVEWLAYDRIEPMGDSWIQSAALLAWLYSFGSKRVVKPHEVYPHLKTPPRARSNEAIARDMDAWAIAHNARIRAQEAKRKPSKG